MAIFNQIPVTFSSTPYLEVNQIKVTLNEICGSNSFTTYTLSSPEIDFEITGSNTGVLTIEDGDFGDCEPINGIATFSLSTSLLNPNNLTINTNNSKPACKATINFTATLLEIAEPIVIEPTFYGAEVNFVRLTGSNSNWKEQLIGDTVSSDLVQKDVRITNPDTDVILNTVGRFSPFPTNSITVPIQGPKRVCTWTLNAGGTSIIVKQTTPSVTTYFRTFAKVEEVRQLTDTTIEVNVLYFALDHQKYISKTSGIGVLKVDAKLVSDNKTNTYTTGQLTAGGISAGTISNGWTWTDSVPTQGLYGVYIRDSVILDYQTTPYELECTALTPYDDDIIATSFFTVTIV